jgi:fumarate hydratase subunit beta
MAEHRITTPVSDDVIETLRAGDTVYITGYLYTGRDSAHKKLIDLINEGKDLPIDVEGQLIYYVGPTPARPGKPIGSAGPRRVTGWIPLPPLSTAWESKARSAREPGMKKSRNP